ncbi:MAG: bifunctional diaminohydroxyphosphoribosylaminopyrimidine deaminase/5-amino-6-(5-phosphoribosylamino)uracil reductase RibD [Actinobacteria bacterium]|nr:bifunctional diaminohydroxyphosphoribosylaminopyrimidine deaminase/5-amino-6-(5-phosphoribosylamino)uracil reductase RibD [Actinomycetota bacterium]
MARALALAERGRATTRPNPVVGAVVVRDGEIVGEGWHERAGGPHAEIVALGAAGDGAQGASVYTTLEPCRHRGRTGPCADALIESGVARVVYGLRDPDPLASGGAERLADAGVQVEGGLLADWVAEQNNLFLHVHAHGRPHVTLKLAQTFDGDLRGQGRWITGARARTAVHRIRARVDAVLVGSGTVIEDDPQLDVRHVQAPGGQPRAVVLDARGRTPLDAKVVRPGTIVLTTDAAPAAHATSLAESGVTVELVPAGDHRGIQLDAALKTLMMHDIRSILVEGGASVAASFVAEQLVDILVLHVAVTTVARSSLPSTPASVVPAEDAGWRWRRERARPLGEDLEIVAVPEAR